MFGRTTSQPLTPALSHTHTLVFVHAAFLLWLGHGGRLPDDDGDEDDGYDETLIPVDFQRAGQIRDDDILKNLVRPLQGGVTMTCLMDCCHSGTYLRNEKRKKSGEVRDRNEELFANHA